MSMEPFDDSFEQFDIEDFDEDFDEDFEAEIEGEYELTNNEYQDFDDPNMIPTIDFSGETDDEEEEQPPAEESEEADGEAEGAENAGAEEKTKSGKKTGK